MKRETLLTVVVILLLILNFATLSFLVSNHPNHLPHHRPPGLGVGAIIAERLHFTPEQNQQFDLLKRAHRSSINHLDADYRQVLISYLSLLKSDKYSARTKDSLESELAKIEVLKADITLSHFREVKSLATAEQRKKFDALFPVLIDVIAPPPFPSPSPQQP